MTAEEANDGNDTFHRDRRQTLPGCACSANFNDVVHAHAAGQLLGRLAPILVFLVVDDVVSAQLLQLLALGAGGCGCNDACTSCLCKLFRIVSAIILLLPCVERSERLPYLQRKDRDTARTLRQHPISRLQALALQAVQRVPRRQTSARQRCTLQEVQVAGHVHQTFLVKDAVLLQSAIDDATDA